MKKYRLRYFFSQMLIPKKRKNDFSIVLKVIDYETRIFGVSNFISIIQNKRIWIQITLKENLIKVTDNLVQL